MAALFISQARSTLAMNTVFLETDMRAAWIALLEAGSSSSSGRHEGGGAGAQGGGPREIVDKMLVDCHGRQNGAWGAECDRALYLDSVLEKVEGSGSNAFASATGTTIAPEEEHREQEALYSAANEIAAMPAGKLPFSTFFHEYAVPGRPVLILSGHGVDGKGGGMPTDLTGEDASENPPHLDLDHADVATDTLPQQTEKERQSCAHERVLSSIDACLPYPVNTTAAVGTVDGPLRACQSILEDFPVPLYVAEDFSQRFRGQDVLPMDEHPAVERFVSG